MQAIFQKLQEEGGKNISTIILDNVRKIGKFFANEVQIRSATDRYAENYLQRYGHIKVLGMPQPYLLNDLYTEVQTLNPQNRIRLSTPRELQETFRYDERGFVEGSRMSGVEMANTYQKLNVLGSPGSGKSTFLKKMGLDCLLYSNSTEDYYRHNCIPVLIELKRYRDTSVTVIDLVQREFEVAGFPQTDQFVLRALKNGLLLILLDGIDEVPETNMNRLLENIKDFSDQYSKNRFITSCRTAYYKTFLKNFTDVEICKFSDGQITDFVRHWFSAEPDLAIDMAGKFTNILFREEHRATLELARTPLLLTFLCLTFDSSQRFPVNRSSLYQHALLILMQKWAAEKRIHHESLYQEFNTELELEMLSDIAAFFYKSDKIFFYGNELSVRIKWYLENKSIHSQLDISKVIHTVEVQQGILVEKSPNVYSFSHLTLQEYLTAYYYRSQIRVGELVDLYLFHRRWREVFILQAGMGDPDALLMLMQNRLGNLAKDNSIISAVSSWARTLVFNEHNPQYASARRVFVVSLLIRFRRYPDKTRDKADRLEVSADALINKLAPALFDFSLSQFGDHLTRKQAIDVLRMLYTWFPEKTSPESFIQQIKAIVPSRPLSTLMPGSRQTYYRQILNVFYLALGAPETCIDLPKSEYNSLIQYIEGISLLLDCIGSSTLVSKQISAEVYRDIF